MYDSTYMRFLKQSNSERQKSRIMISKGWEERRMMSYCLMDIDFQFKKMKRVLEIDGGDGYAAV